LHRRLGGPQSKFVCGGEEKNTEPLLGLRPSIIQPIAQSYTILTYLNHIHGEIKTRQNLGNACYHSFHILLSFHFLSEDLMIEIYKTIILPVVL
jgi:hypothetical protein